VLQGYGLGRLLAANNKLVADGIAVTSTTVLVPFVDDGELNSTSERVAAMINTQQRTEPGIISMSRSWTDEALRFLAREKQADSGVKLVALNYANCTFVGGNYSDGGYVRAQEEELCRQFPALFDSMKTCPEAQAMPGRNGMTEYTKHVFGACFGDGYSVARNVLFTGEVQCLRGGSQQGYGLYQDSSNRIAAGFVEAAAPLFDRGHDSDFQKWRDEPHDWYEKVFLNVFRAPKEADLAYDVLVVGPWGCGAFGNDPHTVAKSFLEIIKKHNLRHLYKEIHFCLGRCMGSDPTVGGACNRNVAAFEQEIAASEYNDVHDYTSHLHAKCEQWTEDERRLAMEEVAPTNDKGKMEAGAAEAPAAAVAAPPEGRCCCCWRRRVRMVSEVGDADADEAIAKTAGETPSPNKR